MGERPPTTVTDVFPHFIDYATQLSITIFIFIAGIGNEWARRLKYSI